MEVTVLSRDVEKAMRTLKKKLQLDGLFGELKKRRHYEKPSVKKKKKRIEAEKRRRKALRRSKSNESSRPPRVHRGPAVGTSAGGGRDTVRT